MRGGSAGRSAVHAMAADPRVLFVGCLNGCVGEEALAAAFAQFARVSEARLLRCAFTGRPLGAGWVRFDDEAGHTPGRSAGAVLEMANVTALLMIGGTPRPVLLGRSLGDVLPSAGPDALDAAWASAVAARPGLAARCPPQPRRAARPRFRRRAGARRARAGGRAAASSGAAGAGAGGASAAVRPRERSPARRPLRLRAGRDGQAGQGDRAEAGAGGAEGRRRRGEAVSLAGGAPLSEGLSAHPSFRSSPSVRGAERHAPPCHAHLAWRPSCCWSFGVTWRGRTLVVAGGWGGTHAGRSTPCAVR